LSVKQDVDAIGDEVQIDMRHHLLNNSGTDYEGSLLYQHNEYSESGNCTGRNTFAGSLFFEKIDAEQKFRSDSSEFCKTNDTPFTNGSLDPTYAYDGLHVGGWGNGYHIFIGNFNRESQTGAFSYLWQAGPHDGYSRILNLNIFKNAQTINADAYFGYGSDLTLGTADPNLLGFFCDWATPSNGKIVQDAVQYQAMHLDGDEFVSDGVNISYAPTHTCDYNPADETDGTFFNYDINADQVLDSADQDLVDLGITNDLLPLDAMDFTPPDDILSAQWNSHIQFIRQISDKSFYRINTF